MTTTIQGEEVVHLFVESAGNLTQSLGLGRVVGQIYAFLYFSPEARTLDDMKTGLGISKGSASMSVRQLQQWGAAERVWVKGDRKDYYRAGDWFGRILREMARDMMGRNLASYSSVIAQAEATLSGDGDDGVTDDEREFLVDRVEHLKVFQGRVSDLWKSTLVQMLLR